MKKLISVVLISLVLSACGSENQKELADASVYISSATYNEELNEYTISYSTMLNYNLQYVAILYNSDDEVIGKIRSKEALENSDVPLESRSARMWIDDHITFKDIGEEPEDELDSDVYLELEIEVDNQKNKNDELVYRSSRSQVVVGSGVELAEHYKDSETVTIIVEDSNSYTMTLTSPLENVEMDSKIAEKAKEDEVLEMDYSSEFIIYNEEFYKSFKNYLDLIAYNFEILAVDGFSNQNIVDDLAIWTAEYNELLATYEVNSSPITTADKELHVLTIEMIKEQSSVNSHVLEGLAVSNSNYFLKVRDPLDKVLDLYTAGNDSFNN